MEDFEKEYLDKLFTEAEGKWEKVAEKFEKYAEKYGKLTEKYASLEGKMDRFLDRWFFKRPEFYIGLLPYILAFIAFLIAWQNGSCIEFGQFKFQCEGETSLIRVMPTNLQEQEPEEKALGNSLNTEHQ